MTQLIFSGLSSMSDSVLTAWQQYERSGFYESHFKLKKIRS